VIVHGNWATVKIKEWRGTLEMVSEMRWICCGSEWCIADDEADVDFPECRYPEAEDQPEVPPVTEAEIRAGFLKALELLEVEMEGEASDDLKSLRELRDRLLAGKR